MQHRIPALPGIAVVPLSIQPLISEPPSGIAAVLAISNIGPEREDQAAQRCGDQG
jgi:hypothetical protein